MSKIISYQLCGGATQLLAGLVVTMKEIKNLKREAQLESEGIETDAYTGIKYAIFHNPVMTKLSNGAYDFGQRYFVEVKEKAAH